MGPLRYSKNINDNVNDLTFKLTCPYESKNINNKSLKKKHTAGYDVISSYVIKYITGAMCPILITSVIVPHSLVQFQTS